MLVLNTDPIAPRKLNPKLSRDLETICLKWYLSSVRELAGVVQAVRDGERR